MLTCSVTLRAMLIALSVAVSGCTDPPRTDVAKAPATGTEQPAFALPTPHFTMIAKPPPPFTYWAPEGSTIRNHPHVPGIWIAEVGPRNQKAYFGDACGASRYQHLVGEVWTNLIAMPPATEIRTFCTNCERNDDLRPSRINVIIDENTSVVHEIACF